MQAQEFRKRFHAALPDNEIFRDRKISDEHWVIESQKCCISFLYERYEPEGSAVILVSRFAESQGMSIFLLRHMRGAADVLPDGDSPENLALVFGRYFMDLLAGDFSIRDECERLSNRFFALSFEVDRLPESDPVRRMYDTYDIGWMDALEKRKSSSPGASF
ncbi:hypothetical protein ACQ859_20125 [Roseateles chitinivorans]|uniref:hypothetical protein n=1 Tax=Roseateles chitinivorans TaxID=2917965 RepID=UPI003D67FE82